MSYKVSGSSIIGEFGFSLTQLTVEEIAKSIYSYCSDCTIAEVVIGFSECRCAAILAKRVIARELLDSGMEVALIEKATTLTEFSWAVSESKSKSQLGVYISGATYFSTDLTISFRDTQGSPLLEDTLLRLLKYPPSTILVEPEERRKPSFLEPGDYIQYLVDSSLIKEDLRSISNVIRVDCMHGASTRIANLLKSKYIPTLSVFRPNSEGIRYINSLGIPTGGELEWSKANLPADPHKHRFHFSISNDGTRLGAWDVSSDTEVTSSGLLVILLDYLTIHKKKGTVVLTRSVSEAVQGIARAAGFKVEIVGGGDKEFKSAISKSRRSQVLLYGDDKGRFWFKGDVMEFNPILAMLRIIQTCNHYSQSLQQVVENISAVSLSRRYAYINFTYPGVTRSILASKIRDLPTYEASDEFHSEIVVKLKKSTRVILQQGLKDKDTEVYVESDDIQTVREVAKSIYNELTL